MSTHTTHRPTHRPTVRRTDRRAVLAREEERFGGTQPGAAFFGWLTAVGLTVLLSGLAVATGATIDLVPDSADSTEIGWYGVLLVVALVLVSFAAGGYVAGRMARFAGLRQGVAVVAWTVVMSVVLSVLGAVAGSQFDLLAQVDGFPTIPGDLGELTLQAGVAVVGVVVATVVGAVAGSLAGVLWHRRVDRAGLAG